MDLKSSTVAYATRSIRTGFLAFAALSTLCLNSVPGLKWGVYFAGTETFTPVLGLRLIQGGRWFKEKTPKSRISTRPPSASLVLGAERNVATQASTSFSFRRSRRDAIRKIRPERVKAMSTRLACGVAIVPIKTQWRCPARVICKDSARIGLLARLTEFGQVQPLTLRPQNQIDRRDSGRNWSLKIFPILPISQHQGKFDNAVYSRMLARGELVVVT